MPHLNCDYDMIPIADCDMTLVPCHLPHHLSRHLPRHLPCHLSPTTCHITIPCHLPCRSYVTMMSSRISKIESPLATSYNLQLQMLIAIILCIAIYDKALDPIELYIAIHLILAPADIIDKKGSLYHCLLLNPDCDMQLGLDSTGL